MNDVKEYMLLIKWSIYSKILFLIYVYVTVNSNYHYKLETWIQTKILNEIQKI